MRNIFMFLWNKKYIFDMINYINKIYLRFMNNCYFLGIAFVIIQYQF